MKHLIILISFISIATTTIAQPVVSRAKVAIFTPLYLDSAFDNNTYKYGKLVPSFAINGLEYYYGAMQAIDSIKKAGKLVDFTIIDTKQKNNSIQQLIANGALDSMHILIGSITNNAEIKLLADYAQKRKIPLISATYPSDAGITNNANFVLLNSTLKTNCKALHEFVKSKFANQRIVVLSKNGKQEERIVTYFKEFEQNSTGTALAIEYINVGNYITEDSLYQVLDSTVLSTYIVASTDVVFAKNMANVIVTKQLQEQSNLIGLPTWDNATEFTKKEYQGIHFYYCTPNITPYNGFAAKLNNGYKNEYGTAAGDNLYRGYESVYKYVNLLLKYTINVSANLVSKEYNTLLNYRIQPTMLNANSMQLDYFENVKVYIIKILNGVTTTLAQ